MELADGSELERLRFEGVMEMSMRGFIKSRLDAVAAVEITTEDEYFDMLISLSEYSFLAFEKDASHLEGATTPVEMQQGDGSFRNLFHYDYSNEVDHAFIGACLANPLIQAPVYELYCAAHSHERSGMCLDCLERYRVVTRKLIPLMKTLRKDLCSIYFIDVLYDLIRFENRDVYAFIAYVVNQFRDGSSFKAFLLAFGKKKARRLLKSMNRPFRRIDYKFVLKKYVPLLYAVSAYCANTRLDCLDRVYDYMLLQGMSMFKTVPSKHVVVGYRAGDGYRVDILETTSVLDFSGDRDFMIASHGLLEGLYFGCYKDRLVAYKEVCAHDRRIKKKLRKVFAGLIFSGRSVFTGRIIHSSDAIIVGFLKKSTNTFQNFQLDLHIECIIPNRPEVDKLRFIKHDEWSFEDNESDACYTDA